jgi:hypothetical protein
MLGHVSQMGSGVERFGGLKLKRRQAACGCTIFVAWCTSGGAIRFVGICTHLRCSGGARLLELRRRERAEDGPGARSAREALPKDGLRIEAWLRGGYGCE